MADKAVVTGMHAEAVLAASEKLDVTGMHAEVPHGLSNAIDVTGFHAEPVFGISNALDVTGFHLEVVHDVGPTGDDKAVLTGFHVEIVHAMEDDDDDPSHPVTSECDGKFGVLVIPLDWPVVLLRGSRVERLKLDSGHVIRLARSLRQRRRWQVQMKAAKPSEKTALLAFWDAHDGVELPYDWRTPDGELVSGRFYRPGLETALKAPLVDSYRFEIEEVFC